MKHKVAVILTLCLILFASCKKEEPDVIPKEKMIELLVDIHKSEAVMTLNHSKYPTEDKKRTMREAVLMEHNITQEDFDKAIEYYSYNIEEYMEIYDCVIDRLKQENEYVKMLIARENAQTLTNEGDTVDIWKQERAHTFNPYIGDNILSFNITKDDNFNTKDLFTLRFHVINAPKYNKAKAYLAIRHAQQNIHYNYCDIEGDGWYTLQLQSDSVIKLAEIYGYINMPQQPYQHIMYMDSIELVRIHNKPGMERVEYNVIETQQGRIKKHNDNAKQTKKRSERSTIEKVVLEKKAL